MRTFIALAIAAGFARCSYAAPCDSLASLQLPNTTVTAAESHTSGAFVSPTGQRLRVGTDFCRVAVTLKPSPDSNIRAEIWLPATAWNGKFQGIGNGGFAGSIAFDSLASAVARGYATASTDTGHQGGDATWALGHPGKIADFGYRAIHETTVAAKAVIHAFYGDAPKQSYFNACSNGGRQALMEAQRYPADYDGIVAGAPAYPWTHLMTAAIFDMQAMADPAGYIPASKLPAIESAALSACDTLDGVKDGVIENPAQCRFDPGALLCKGEESAACLTAPQLTTLRKIYAGPGAAIMPGYAPGGEAESGGWAAWISGATPGKSAQAGFGEGFFKFMVYGDAAWEYKTSSFDRDAKDADSKMAGILNATDTNLKPFRDRGGKLILYHGWSDAAIPPQSTVNYYQDVVQRVGAKDAANFVRLFMAPGVQHCFGGAGPNVFGQGGAPVSDADHDVDAAVERWVEQGIAPESVIATKYKSGTNAASGIERTRPLCSYPKTAHWDGKGSTDDAASFVCK